MVNKGHHPQMALIQVSDISIIICPDISCSLDLEDISTAEWWHLCYEKDDMEVCLKASPVFVIQPTTKTIHYISRVDWL